MNDGFIPKTPSDNDLITDADKRLFCKIRHNHVYGFFTERRA